ncbi:YecA family protein [Chromobacterium sp. IIBBL 290-4]|uniref:YecA/YgfB family protein n=1 Tax=Chromobacterium sp. IIBBL 290-4 TaxID=2953890 RepID=UPI0020B858D4|nr:YecA family protein [Chromobacterium sp. IIBBL 290-4]UTH74146.1 YecA family protein [Chromobacterium sp. IIBBL 290-4]
MSNKPLSDQDYQRLSATLDRFADQQCMNLEKLDGFFASLLAGPEAIRPAECLPLILGDAFDDEAAFPSEKSLEQFVALLRGHWQDIADALNGGEFQPWLDADQQGEVKGNDWCEGFVAGMELLNEDWGMLFDSPENAPLLEPIMALGFERHPDAEMRPFVDGISSDLRNELLAALSPSVHGIHDFFSAVRKQLEQEELELEKQPTRH